MNYKVILEDSHKAVLENNTFQNIEEASDYVEKLIDKLDMGFEIKAYEKIGEEWKLIRRLRKKEA